ncbi:MAG: PqqD family peptide modification chaperone [Phycisphaerales bacterium]
MSFERPTFSPLWHRVRTLKPRLRPHVQVTRQHYRGRRWHVVHDPSSNNFYRLSPVAHELVGLLDGRRTVEETWNAVLGNHGDAAPTQQEVIELLGQMYNSNLLAIDLAPETEQLLRRGRERVKRRIAQQAIGIMYFRLRLFNPDRMLSWLEPILRPLLNRWGLLLWAAFIAVALYNLLPRWEELASGFSDAIAPSNWVWLSVIFIAIKAIHEVGHGVITRRFGGQVPEFGVMLLVLFPAPYVDASAVWAFPSKWRRIAVGAGGMIFELAIAAGAAFLWLNTSKGELLHQLAFNAMLTASFTTLLFNANPLMRFDGYYILSDLLEVPNLMQRSMKYLQHLCQKHIYRVEQTRPPATAPGELAILFLYGVGALAYRVFLFFSITLFMLGLKQLFALALILAIWTAAAWFIIPIGKFIHWLASSPQLAEFRPRAIATTVLLFLAGAVTLGVIPMPDRRQASGVVEGVLRTGVFFGTDGFIARAHVQVGDAVKAGDPIVTCESPELATRLALAEAQLAEYEAAERQHMVQHPALAQIDRQKIAAVSNAIDLIRERMALQVVRAPHDGVVVPGLRGVDPQSVVGSFARRGQGLCEVVDTTKTRVAAVLSTAQFGSLMELEADAFDTEVRPYSDPHTVMRVAEVHVIEAGQHTLPHQALSFAGGGTFETDPQDRTATATKGTVFIARLDGIAAGAGPEWVGVPGERVRVRFALPPQPLLSQWIGRLHRIIQERGPDI